MNARQELESKLAIPEMMFSIERGVAMLVFKQREKLHMLSSIKQLTAQPRGDTRRPKLKAILENYNG